MPSSILHPEPALILGAVGGHQQVQDDIQIWRVCQDSYTAGLYQQQPLSLAPRWKVSPFRLNVALAMRLATQPTMPPKYWVLFVCSHSRHAECR